MLEAPDGNDVLTYPLLAAGAEPPSCLPSRTPEARGKGAEEEPPPTARVGSADAFRPASDHGRLLFAAPTAAAVEGDAFGILDEVRPVDKAAKAGTGSPPPRM